VTQTTQTARRLPALVAETQGHTKSKLVSCRGTVTVSFTKNFNQTPWRSVR
jgi:hypothetical protein